MDMFYQSLPGERKQRLHFHRFMLRVHEELTTLQGHSDPLEIVADRFKAQTDVLCFDEFCLRHHRCHAARRLNESAVLAWDYAGCYLKHPAGRALPQWSAARAFLAGDRRHQTALRHYERRCGD